MLRKLRFFFPDIPVHSVGIAVNLFFSRMVTTRKQGGREQLFLI